ncbi:membrane protein, putative [Lactobacillus acidipiscis] [Lactiplantibacillus mudanjiangensis]|uniref:PTS sugar transporter subunit IIC n=1 Tax=Lactiplantibacillus mudanjiangensis TaxID=1296538 RepID=UPI0010151E7E|nr:PTS sugar transporter subunit IIC [Lactiplantibacillus mudanjiangensis]VDG32056.1 membrane protein, putative [Lactobacillus acidipiscis] [Lactiplantibacillus mudanjiangensis]
MQELRQYKVGEFWNKLLSGIAMAIVVAVTPGAIISPFIGGLAKSSAFWAAINTATNMGIYIVPVAAGVLAADQFGFTMIEKASVSLAAIAGSGAVVYAHNTWTLVGMGDLINTILVIAIAIVTIFLVRPYVGSFSIIWEPILCGSVIGAFGMWSYQYVHMISMGVGNILNAFTTLQPILLCTLIAMSFAVIIATPLSTVGLAYAIGISGIAGGAASVGATACFMMVAVATYKVNGKGVAFAMFWGSVKMMLANFVKHPRMLLPIAIVGAMTGFTDAFLGIKAGAAYAGFGQPVGPINSFTYMSGSTIVNVIVLALIYFILPIIYSLIAYVIFRKMPKLYDENDWKIDLSK